MKYPSFSDFRSWGVFGCAAALLVAFSAAPAFAAPTTLSFSGSVDTVSTVPGASFPISQGDSLSGMVKVNTDASGGFDLNGLQSFDLSVGSTMFNLGSADFASFSGMVSGSTLTDFELATQFGGNGLALGFNGVNQAFSVSGAGGGIASGPYSVGVSAAAVPEPTAWLSFGLGLAVIGFAMRRRRSANRS